MSAAARGGAASAAEWGSASEHAGPVQSSPTAAVHQLIEAVENQLGAPQRLRDLSDTYVVVVLLPLVGAPPGTRQFHVAAAFDPMPEALKPTGYCDDVFVERHEEAKNCEPKIDLAWDDATQRRGKFVVGKQFEVHLVSRALGSGLLTTTASEPGGAHKKQSIADADHLDDMLRALVAAADFCYSVSTSNRLHAVCFTHSQKYQQSKRFHPKYYIHPQDFKSGLPSHMRRLVDEHADRLDKQHAFDTSLIAAVAEAVAAGAERWHVDGRLAASHNFPVVLLHDDAGEPVVVTIDVDVAANDDVKEARRRLEEHAGASLSRRACKLKCQHDKSNCQYKHD